MFWAKPPQLRLITLWLSLAMTFWLSCIFLFWILADPCGLKGLIQSSQSVGKAGTKSWGFLIITLASQAWPKRPWNMDLSFYLRDLRVRNILENKKNKQKGLETISHFSFSMCLMVLRHGHFDSFIVCQFFSNTHLIFYDTFLRGKPLTGEQIFWRICWCRCLQQVC